MKPCINREFHGLGYGKSASGNIGPTFLKDWTT
ncbi:hypothetical protein EV192_106625 [Actinocrispum wychmicini]|uniref:Uncharacterized protein n=1 Tax=Actinocrispum wychmicini TaxID=1213861 RepID=A0A4R2JJG5_9PSEU|nr:hypothetical protein EV192_106625 [Actinocrispum wychmicini]